MLNSHTSLAAQRSSILTFLSTRRLIHKQDAFHRRYWAAVSMFSLGVHQCLATPILRNIEKEIEMEVHFSNNYDTFP